MHTIALVEDDPGLRDTLTQLIAGTRGWKITGAYPSAEAALPALKRQPPHVVLMDINLPGISGIECVQQIKKTHPDLLVLMLTVYDNSDQVFAALAAGACGYLLKRDIPHKLLPALDDALTGGSPMSSHIARQVVRFFHTQGRAKKETDDLTPRERQILELLAQGSLYKEIASDLGIGTETVNTHIRNIYAKLHVRSRTEAVVKFLAAK
jgi:DNA-binding NarL/FixJ family response regulator